MFNSFISMLNNKITENQQNVTNSGIINQWSRYGSIEVIKKDKKRKQYQFFQEESLLWQDGVEHLKIESYSSLIEHLKHIFSVEKETVINAIAKTTFPDVVLEALDSHFNGEQQDPDKSSIKHNVTENRILKITVSNDESVTMEQEVVITKPKVNITLNGEDIKEVYLKLTESLKIKAMVKFNNDEISKHQVNIYLGDKDITDTKNNSLLNEKEMKAVKTEAQNNWLNGKQTHDVLYTARVESAHLLLSNNIDQLKESIFENLKERVKMVPVAGKQIEQSWLVEAMKDLPVWREKKSLEESFYEITKLQKSPGSDSGIGSEGKYLDDDFDEKGGDVPPPLKAGTTFVDVCIAAVSMAGQVSATVFNAGKDTFYAATNPNNEEEAQENSEEEKKRFVDPIQPNNCTSSVERTWSIKKKIFVCSASTLSIICTPCVLLVIYEQLTPQVNNIISQGKNFNSTSAIVAISMFSFFILVFAAIGIVTSCSKKLDEPIASSIHSPDLAMS